MAGCHFVAVSYTCGGKLQEDRMEPWKISAFFKEFTFLHDYVSQEEVTSARVGRIDRAVLEATPVDWSDDYYMAGYDIQTQKTLLLDGNGRVIREVQSNTMDRYGRIGDKLRVWFTKNPPRRVSGEKIGDAILSLKESDQERISYLCIVTSRLEWPNVWKRKISLCKLPTRFRLAEWIAQEDAKEQAALKKQLQEV